MSRHCMITAKKSTRGNNVAHCNKKVRRNFRANIRWKRFWLESEKRWVRIRVSSKGMRIIDKYGIDAMMSKLKLTDSIN
ncbi:MAG: 50S ribosomal protein L28 [Gammaproteobacteria bacterium]